mmetsp:Transcript_3917/g.7050  ORF Transcript_3917/g.7050 Transcript_3917/m.7050 type:complete len:291 (-) Transcript_3917:313-1185(-)
MVRLTAVPPALMTTWRFRLQHQPPALRNTGDRRLMTSCNWLWNSVIEPSFSIDSCCCLCANSISRLRFATQLAANLGKRVWFCFANRQGLVLNMCSAVTCSSTCSSWRETQEMQSTGQDRTAQCRSSSLSPHCANTLARESSASMQMVFGAHPTQCQHEMQRISSTKRNFCCSHMSPRSSEATRSHKDRDRGLPWYFGFSPRPVLGVHGHTGSLHSRSSWLSRCSKSCWMLRSYMERFSGSRNKSKALFSRALTSSASAPAMSGWNTLCLAKYAFRMVVASALCSTPRNS